MRARPVRRRCCASAASEVFYVHDLLAETLAASDEARRKLIERRLVRVHRRLVAVRRGARALWD